MRGKEMSEDFAYLNEERIKLWSAVRDIEAKFNDLIKSTPLKLQQEARGQLNKASEYCNRISDRKAEVDSKFSDIMQRLTTIQESAESLSIKLNEVNERYQQAQEQFTKINEAYEEVSSSNEEWGNRLTLMDQNYDTTNEWIKTAKEQANKIQVIHGECESNAKKINVLLTQAAEKKQVQLS